MPAPRLTIDELPEDTDVAGTEWLIVQASGVSKKMAINTLTAVSQTSVTAHIDDTADAHDASAISATTSSATVNGTDVQSQLGQLATLAHGASADADAVEVGLADHLADIDGAHGASAISITTVAGIAATNVQVALEEIVSGGGAGTGGTLPPGGAAGEVLTKDSGTDNDASWAAVDLSSKVTNGGGVDAIQALTQATYDALAVKSPGTLYVIIS